MRIVLLIFILGWNFINAQEQKVLKLEYVSKNFLDFDVEGIDNLFIFENNSKTLYIVGEKYDVKSTSKKTAADIVLKMSYKTGDEYYFQDKVTDSLFFKDIVIQDIFYVKEKLPQFKWMLVEEYREIENKKLQKATTSFRGRNYTAWCDLENPINQGPWKFNNLPGLAYSIIDETPNFYFEWHLSKISHVLLKEVPITRPETKKYIEIREFVDSKIKVYKEFEEKSKARSSNIPGLEEISNNTKTIDRKIRSNEIKYEWED